MYNLHCHSLLSDGALLPSEIAVRYLAQGYKAIAITDHVDYSNIKDVCKQIVEFCRKWPAHSGITVLPGVELTHIPPEQFEPLAKLARKLGAKIIVAHGETPVEPITPGTNRAALLAGIDILAHPGKITALDASLAAKKGIFLEVTARKGHRLTNHHVVTAALKAGAPLAINHDSHLPEDIISPAKTVSIALQAGLNREQIGNIYKEVSEYIKTRTT